MWQSSLRTEPMHVDAMTHDLALSASGARLPRMLIADDDPTVVDFLAERLLRRGFVIDTASDGTQAFLKASRRRPDILVIDVNMPDVDGLSVCAHLQDADRAPASVIMITGSRDPHILGRCETVGGYYARKGPNFWNDLEAALDAIPPV
jgi:CheY-like chemotaxis protein